MNCHRKLHYRGRLALLGCKWTRRESNSGPIKKAINVINNRDRNIVNNTTAKIFAIYFVLIKNGIIFVSQKHIHIFTKKIIMKIFTLLFGLIIAATVVIAAPREKEKIPIQVNIEMNDISDVAINTIDIQHFLEIVNQIYDLEIPAEKATEFNVVADEGLPNRGYLQVDNKDKHTQKGLLNKNWCTENLSSIHGLSPPDTSFSMRYPLIE